jgi:hypothetical protein
MLAVAAAVLSLAALAGSPPSAPGTSLRVVVKDPLTLRAAGFGSRETVRLVVRSPAGTVTRKGRSTRAGVFTVAFPGLALDGRTDLDVSAVGARGHRASFSLRHVTGGSGGGVSTT